MQLKLTTEYAIRIALYLAEQNGVCTSKEIAEYTQISPNYVLKILRVLAKASLVQNHIGVYGGFSLQTAAFWEHFGRGKPGTAGGIFPENAGGKGPKDLKNP